MKTGMYKIFFARHCIGCEQCFQYVWKNRSLRWPPGNWLGQKYLSFGTSISSFGLHCCTVLKKSTLHSVGTKKNETQFGTIALVLRSRTKSRVQN